MGYIFTGESVLLGMIRRFMRIMLKICLRPRNHWLILQNDSDAEAFRRGNVAAPDRTRVIRGSGVDIGQFRPTDRSKRRGLVASVVGRQLRDKGIREAVLAARELARREVPVAIRLVGRPDPGNPSSIPDEVLNQWQREGCVERAGYVDDMVALWDDSDVAVLPSYREGLPKSLLEAASSGLPIVTTDVPGCRDAVEDGVTGYIVPVCDWIALADAIERLVENPELRRSMGAAARERVIRNFSDTIVIDKTLTLYFDALSSARIAIDPDKPAAVVR
jgi:glycosyltransferase involved in cell wall biosynthesis